MATTTYTGTTATYSTYNDYTTSSGTWSANNYTTSGSDTWSTTSCSSTAEYCYDSNIVWIHDYRDYTFEVIRIDPIRAHHLRMQAKLQEEWDKIIEQYYRNENHTREMQKKINREWDNHLRRLKYAEDKEKRELPEKKAQELLGLLIGEDQLEVYRKTGRVFVKGKKGQYMVKKGGGVSKIKGKKIIDFCVHIESKYKCPPTDHAIALKMMLEEDDKKVIKIANRISSRVVSELPKAACM